MNPQSKRTVLVIDDEEGFCFFIKANLEMIGAWQVITALDGAKGVELAVREEPHVILLDIIMPKLNGFETLKKLREHKKTRHIPVIMMTAVGKGVSRLKGEEILAEEDYLIKPFLTEELIEKIEGILRSKRG
jgi:DNA-binding response OmpR family regulator